jgi:Spy/CpxP family protein refolding chaperone
MAKRICVTLTLATCLFSVTSAWSQPYGMGPGMMGGGYGMGQGMMGEYGMGPGMMGGYGQGGWRSRIPNLTDEQRTTLDEVEKSHRQKQWQLMEKMHEFHFQSDNVYRDGKFDEQAARKNYDAMTALRKQMFENSIDERKRIESILTPQQREQIQRSWGGR